MTRDMTAGKPFPLILSFTVSIILGNLFQQLYGILDSIIVSRTLGEDALAALGSTGSISFFVFGFCFGLAGGFSIPIAQSFGAKDFSALRGFIGNTIWLFLFFSLTITTLTALTCKQLLALTNTPQNIMPQAYQFLLILFLGIPVQFALSILTGILRALGDSKTPVFILISASILNIGLDFLFILQFRLGVSGAALATIGAQAIASVICLLVILRKFPLLHLRKEDLALKSQMIKRLLSIGVPMGLQFSITGIGNVVLQSAINALGSSIVAAVTAASKISSMFSCITDAMGAAMATFCAQNIGAGQLGRIRKGIKSSVAMSLVYAIIGFAICLLVGKPLTQLFLSDGPAQSLDLAYQYLLINTLFLWSVGFVNIFRMSIQGLGFGRMAMFAGALEMIGRCLAAFLVPAIGFIAVCLASPIAWILANAFLIPTFYHLMKRYSTSNQ